MTITEDTKGEGAHLGMSHLIKVNDEHESDFVTVDAPRTSSSTPNINRSWDSNLTRIEPDRVSRRTPELTEEQEEEPIKKLIEERDEAKRDARENQEQLEALLEALELLSKLAAMDPGAYRDSLRRSESLSEIAGNEKLSTSKSSNATGLESQDVIGCDPKSNSSMVDSRDSDDTCCDPSVLQGQLDALHARWRLEETPLPIIVQSVHRLQSNLTQLTSEADETTTEIHALQSALQRARSRVHKLEKAVKKLFKENSSLKEKIRRKKRERTSLVRNVKDYMGNMQLLKKREDEIDAEERSVANQLRAHERLLRLKRMRATNVLLEGDKDVPGVKRRSQSEDFQSKHRRDREDSLCVLDDSFSDIDAGVGENFNYDFESGSSVDGTDSSVVSEVSSISARSLVTDECPATVRITSEAVPKPASRGEVWRSEQTLNEDDGLGWGSMNLPSFMGGGEKGNSGEKGGGNKASVGSSEKDKELVPTRSIFHLRIPRKEEGGKQPQTPPPVYKLTFPSGRKTGLQFQKVPLEVCASIGKKKRKVGVSGLLSNAMKDETAEAKEDGDGVVTASSSAADANSKSNSTGFILDLSFLARHDDSDHTLDAGAAEGNRDDGAAAPEYAFLVCGFKGFNSSLNDRPTVGARLVAVDEESLEERRWTLEEVGAAMRVRATTCSPGGSLPSTFTMSFRDDPLSKRQKDMLDKAVAAAEKKKAMVEPNVSNDASGGVHGEEKATSKEKIDDAATGPSSSSDTVRRTSDIARDALKPAEHGGTATKGEKVEELHSSRTESKSKPKKFPSIFRLKADTEGNPLSVESEADNEATKSGALPSPTVEDKTTGQTSDDASTTSPSADKFKTSMRSMSKKFKAFF